MLKELQRLLIENAAFTPPLRVIDAVPDAARTLRPAGAPHSIVEELWHIVYWQDRFLRWARQEHLPYPEKAGLGWRKFDVLDNSEWEDLVTRFREGLLEASGMAAQKGVANQHSTLEEPGSNTGPLTVLEVLANLAVHNAYHLGRIVLLRQMQHSWPPPGGGDTC